MLRSECSVQAKIQNSAQIKVLRCYHNLKKCSDLAAEIFSKIQKVLRFSAQLVLRLSWAKTKTLCCRRPSWTIKTQLNGSSAVVWLSFWSSTPLTWKKRVHSSYLYSVCPPKEVPKITPHVGIIVLNGLFFTNFININFWPHCGPCLLFVWWGWRWWWWSVRIKTWNPKPHISQPV